MNIIDEIVQYYNNASISMLNSMKGSRSLSEECGFLEDTDIIYKVEKLKKEMSTISKSMATNQCDRKDIEELQKRYNDKLFSLVYLASNSIDNIEQLMRIANKEWRFYSCLMALFAYNRKQYSTAYELLHQYIGNKEFFEGHFLLNYVYADLLIKNNRIVESQLFIMNSLKLRPLDIKCHEILCKVYEFKNNQEELITEKQILLMLKGK